MAIDHHETFEPSARQKWHWVGIPLCLLGVGVGTILLSKALHDQPVAQHPVILFCFFITGALFCLSGLFGIGFGRGLKPGARFEGRDWLRVTPPGPMRSVTIRVSDITAVAQASTDKQFFSVRTADESYRLPNFKGGTRSLLDWVNTLADAQALPSGKDLEFECGPPHPAFPEGKGRIGQAFLRTFFLLIGTFWGGGILAAVLVNGSPVWLALALPVLPLLSFGRAIRLDHRQSWVGPGEVPLVIFDDDGITISTHRRSKLYRAEDVFAFRQKPIKMEGGRVYYHSYTLTFLDGATYYVNGEDTAQNVKRVLTCAKRRLGSGVGPFLLEKDLEGHLT